MKFRSRPSLMSPFIKLALVVLALTGCGNKAVMPLGSVWKSAVDTMLSPEVNTLTVLDTNQKPIANAKVMIGTAVNTPFTNNILMTDNNGQWKAPAEWTSAQPVTIQAAGYIRATYFGQMPKGQNFSLKAQELLPTVPIKGNGQNFSGYIVEKDGILDFAIVLPMFTRQDLFFLNQSTVTSSETDTMSVLGQDVKVPSNIIIPQQKEKYGLFSFTADKNYYHFKLNEVGETHLVAVRARAPVKSLASNSGFMGILNDTEVTGAGFAQGDITTAGGVLDMPVNQMDFKEKVSVTAPVLTKGTMMLAMPLSQNGNFLYPTDIKALKSKESRNLTAQNASTLVTIWTDQDLANVSTASAIIGKVQPQSQALQFLNLLNKPTYDGNGLHSQPPATVSGITPRGTYVARFSLNNSVALRNWEFFADDWVSDLTPPAFPDALTTDQSIMADGSADSNKSPATVRWEVSYLGQDGSSLGTSLDDVTHVTRAFADF